MDMQKLENFETIFENEIIHIKAFGREWKLFRGGDLEDLWDQMTEDDFKDERMPYWTELWPASLALSYWLNMNKQQIKGKLCLDLGCGLGFTAIVGQWLGANMLAADYEMVALKYGSRNADANNIPQPTWLAMDWRNPALKNNRVWRIWAGDILYERRSMPVILDFVEQVLSPDGAAWFAEPGRKIFDHFLAAAQSRQLTINQVFGAGVEFTYCPAPVIGARIWEMRRLING